MATTPTLLAVKFETFAQSHGPGRVTIPAAICKLLGIDRGAQVDVVVESPIGRFGPVRKELQSDRELQFRGDDSQWVPAGARVVVTVEVPGRATR